MEIPQPEPKRDYKINFLIITLIGLIGTIISLSGNDNLYVGQELTDKRLVLSSKPEVIHRHKKPDYFVLKDQHYPCTFLISEGAYTLVKKYKQIQRLINAMNEGDTIQVHIMLSEENAVYDASKQVKIIGLKYNTLQLISPEDVKKEDKKNSYLLIGTFSAIFLIGFCTLFYKMIFSSGN